MSNNVAQRVAELEQKIGRHEERLNRMASDMESEKGTKVRMEARLHENMGIIHTKIDLNRINTDDKYAKLSRLVYMGCGAMAALEIILKLVGNHH